MVLESLFLRGNLWWAFLLLIPLILLYLMKPKPIEQILPSLMFLMGQKGKGNKSAFFYYLLHDILLIFHFLIITLLILAIVQPYANVQASTAADSTILIIDNSASMQAQNREAEARQIALENVGSTNVIILAASTPETLTTTASSREAQRQIRNWQASDQPGSLGRAILQASNFADANTHAVIISDFKDSDQTTNWQQALNALKTKGASIQLEQVGTSTSNNVAITQGAVSETSTTLFIRNYRDEAVSSQICLLEVCRPLEIEPQGDAQARFQTPAGTSQALLDVNDELEVDNYFYVSAPNKREIDVLVVTNGDWQASSLKAALDTITEATPLEINVRVNRPPQLTTVNQDLVIFYEVDTSLLVSRTIRETKEVVQGGGAAIVVAQSDIFAVDFEDLLPVTYEELRQGSRVINTQNVPGFVGISYGSVTEHFAVNTNQPIQALAVSNQDEPLITLSNLGRGQVLYYGLMPEESSFDQNPQYAVFWKRVMDELLARENIDELNMDTGTILNAPSITKPDQTTSQDQVILDQQGIYRSDQQTIAASLNDAPESRLDIPDLSQISSVNAYLTSEAENRQPLTFYLALAVLSLLLIEIIYMKWRGDV